MKLTLFGCYLWFLAAIPLSAVSASVHFVQPAPGAAFNGGKTLDVQWVYSDSPDSQVTSSKFSLYLCAGGNEVGSYKALMPLVEHGVLHEINSVSTVIHPDVGGVSPNAYFLQFTINVSNGTTFFFSERFTLTGMTGAFHSQIIPALKTISGTTAGPLTYHDLHKREVAAAPTGDQADIPYGKQTGLTRYAPVPKLPPTKMSLKSAAPLFPTSAYKLATTHLPTPTIQTTISAPAKSVKQMENTAAPAHHPDDDMHKFMKRWKD